MFGGGQVVIIILVLMLTTVTVVMVVLVEMMVVVSQGDSEKLNVLVCVPWHRCFSRVSSVCAVAHILAVVQMVI